MIPTSAHNKLILPAHGWIPEPHQREAYYEISKFDKLLYVLAWHRRCGKDEIALHLTMKAAMRSVGNYVHLLTKKEQAKTAIWNGVNPRTGRRRWMDAFPKELILKTSEVDKMVYFINGSTWKVDGIDNYENIVGGSPKGIVMSEFAQASPQAYAYLRPIVRQNKGWILAVSSVRGKNHFYDLYNTALKDKDEAYASLLSAEDTGVFTPSELLKEEDSYISIYGNKVGKTLFRQEYMSDWAVSAIGTVFTEELEKMQVEGRITVCKYAPEYPVYTSWDFGVNDLTVVVFWQLVGSEVRMIDVYANNNKAFAHYKNVLDERRSKYGYSYILHLAPHDGNNRSFMEAASIRTQALNNFGFEFTVMPRQAKDVTIADMSALFENTIINADMSKYCSENAEGDCAMVVSAMQAYRYDYDKVRRISSNKPRHDWTSHYMDAVGVFAQYRKLYTGVGKTFTQREKTSIFKSSGYRPAGFGLG